jgi:hypothetical protein
MRTSTPGPVGALVALAVGTVVVASAVVAAPPPDIPADAILNHIRYLASDDLKGRGNGSPELDRAAEYIAQQFAEVGLTPGGAGGAWFQPFELVAGLTVGTANSLTIRNRDKTATFTLGESFYPMAATSNDAPAAPSNAVQNLPLVFAGYGLSVPSIGYNDYSRVDVTGKAVLIFSHEPQEQNPASTLNGTRPVAETTLRAKAGLARDRGAKLLIVVSDPTHTTDQADYKLFTADPDAEDLGIPVLRARRTEMRPLIQAWGLDGAARLIDKDLVPRSRELRGATVDYVEQLAKNRRTVRNVVGILRGSVATRAHETVVVGAHYDHVGLGGRLSVTPDRVGEIHNGADDNASGTAAIIEIARAARSQPERFPRTLVFVAFAGEERGLLGSAHYATSPALPIGDTVAMLNLDMIGRARGSVDVSGLEFAPSIEADLESAAKAAGGLGIRRQGPGAGRSDDSSFLNQRVPAINFFTGFHGDYHRPSDDVEQIDAAGTSRVAALALELAARLATRSDRPAFVQQR